MQSTCSSFPNWKWLKKDIFMSSNLRANHLTLGGGGGWVILKKISCKRLLEEKHCMQHKCNRKLMGKKGEKNPAHQIARKKNSWWPEITHPSPQELNGRPLIISSTGCVFLLGGGGGRGLFKVHHNLLKLSVVLHVKTDNNV